jgi:hypothetical protein
LSATKQINQALLAACPVRQISSCRMSELAVDTRLRTEALLIPGGLGEPNLDSFVPETRDLIKRGKELIDEGRSSEARVVTYEDLL